MTAKPKYVLDMTKDHNQSLIELINHDNADTIGTPLTLLDTILRDERVLEGEELVEKARGYGVTVQVKDVADDFVEVFFNKVMVEDVVTMSSAGGDFDWYAPEDWDDQTSPALAIEAFSAACVRDGIDPTKALGRITVARTHDQTENRFFLTFDFTSFVFKTGARFAMPKHFSEIITVRDLRGFIYSPIQPEDVVE